MWKCPGAGNRMLSSRKSKKPYVWSPVCKKGWIGNKATSGRDLRSYFKSKGKPGDFG